MQGTTHCSLFKKLAPAVLAVIMAVLPECASAVDVVVTRQQTYRGTVKSVSAAGIQFEIQGTGVITIPRAAVTQMRVEAPPSITRGIAAYENGNIREARQSLDRVVFQYQGLDIDWAMKGLLYFGWASLRSKDEKQAERAFKAFTQAYPESDLEVEARLGLAEIKLLNKDYDKALDELREMAGIYDSQLKPPADQTRMAAGVYLGIGKALEAKEQLTDALNAYLRVIALYPDESRCPDALYGAGIIFSKLDQFGKAERMLNDLVANYPTHEQAKQAETVLPEISAKAKAMTEAGEQSP